jgi:hypothetical protein
MACTWGCECRECRSALDVAALAQGVERDPPKRRVGDLPGTVLPVSESAVDAWKDRQPIAQRGIDKRGSQ